MGVPGIHRMAAAGRALARVLLVVAGVLCGAAAFELGLRSWSPQLLATDRLRYVPDHAAGFRLEPLQVVSGADRCAINELGLRGPPL